MWASAERRLREALRWETELYLFAKQRLVRQLREAGLKEEQD